MIKITVPNSWDFDGPAASLVLEHSRGLDSAFLEKRAAAGVFKNMDLKADKGHSLIHLIALGDAEVYGGNRNGDWFFSTGRRLEIPEPNWDRVWCQGTEKTGGFWQPRTEHKLDENGKLQVVNNFTDTLMQGNKERADTFVKWAHVFKHHQNKPYERPDPDNKNKLLPPDKIYGSVKAAAHNPVMARVELMIQVPHGIDWDSDLEKLASGEDIPFSMASKVPYDVCLTCGHKSPKVEYYCPHVANHMTMLTKTGHMHGVANDMQTFFDISRVRKPADRIAWSLYPVLTKAAAANEGMYKLAAELANDPEYGLLSMDVPIIGEPLPKNLQHRVDLVEKAAAIEKRVPAIAKGASPLVKGISLKSDHQVKVASRQLPEMFKAMADAGVCLPFVKWAQLVLGDRYQTIHGAVKTAQSMLPGAYGKSGKSVAHNSAYDPAGRPDYALVKTASQLGEFYGLLPEQVSQRAVRYVIQGSNSPTAALGDGIVKKASDFSADPAAEGLVREYLSYQLSYLDAVSRTRPHDLDFVLQAAVLQNSL